MIVKDLSSWISDSGDQVVAINLLDSQNSNKYFNAHKYEIKKYGKYFSVKLDVPTEKPDELTLFFYKVEGIMDNGIFVIQTVENGGGTGYFYNLLLVRIHQDMGFGHDEHGKLTLNRKRILIEKLGEIPLGDRVKATIKIEKNNIIIENEDVRPGSIKTSTEKKIISLENK